MTELLQERWPELLDKTLEHLLLTGLSTSIAVLLGIPLGIIVLRVARLRSLLMAVIGILQTIPSLALLAFLLPLFGIGLVPALIALTLYALLPIVRNTLIGLQSLPHDVLEACAALGYTPRQQLLQVELPLALPVIVAGIRTAAVISVGIATLAAFIGAGGLGDFIVRGLATNNTQLILLGAIPAACLALLLDFAIQKIENRLTRRRNMPGRWLWLSAMILAIGSVLIVSKQHASDRHNTVIVASKNFTEQLILSEIIAQLLERHTDLTIERKLNLGSVTLCHQAMLNGEIDIYPEYTGTAFRTILNRQDNLSAEDTFAAVDKAYRASYQLQWLQPFGFNNTYAVAVREAFAERYQLQSISDLRALVQPLSIGFASEFYERVDGYPGFTRHYNLMFANRIEMDLGLLFQAVADERVDLAVGNSTDGRIATLNLHILDDDKNYFPPYFAAPIVRQAVLDEHPEIAAVLSQLADTITAETMQRLNFQVNSLGSSVTQAASEFLHDAQLLIAEGR